MRKADIVVVMVHYSRKIQIKIITRKDTWGKVQEKPSISFQAPCPSAVTRTCFIHPATVCDDVYKALSTKAAHPSLDVPEFCCRSAREAGSTA